MRVQINARHFLRLRKNDQYYSRFILPGSLRFSSISAKAISPANRTNRIVIDKELNLDLPILKCSTNMAQSIRREYPFCVAFLFFVPRRVLDVIIIVTTIDFPSLQGYKII